MRAVPEVRRQSLKCFKMASDIDITLHVCTYTCFPHCGYSGAIIPNITTYMVAMTTLPPHVRSTSKCLAITLLRTADNEAKLAWKVLIFMTRKIFALLKYTNLCHNRIIRYNSSANQVKHMRNKIVTPE